MKGLRICLYVVKEGLLGVVRTRWQALACILALAISTALLVFFAAAGRATITAVQQAARSASVLVYLKAGIAAEVVESLMRQIGQQPGVESVKYLSAEEDRARSLALLPRDLREALPEDAIQGQHCLLVQIGGASRRDVERLPSFLRRLEEVDLVASPPVGAEKLVAVGAALRGARTILTVMAGLLLIGTLFFVVATLTTTMERRKEEVAILRLVGATESFVVAPVFLQAVVEGVAGCWAGAIVAGLLVDGTNAVLRGRLGLAMQLPDVGPGMTVVSVLGGLAVGFLASLLAIRRREWQA